MDHIARCPTSDDNIKMTSHKRPALVGVLMMLLDECGLLVMRGDRTIEISASTVYVPS